jgi:EAL domain-containing protein (putative c-di-GMP-specific phosphodiesterase class I)
LQVLCPDLAQQVAAFEPATGVIMDQRRLDGRAGRRTIALALTITRVRPGVHMAVLKDVTRLTDMLAYAFASADLLLDVDADGTIGWAGGAFRTLLDMQPQDAVGRKLTDMVTPQDCETLAQALPLMRARGRLSPLLLRLANEAQLPCVLSGLAVEGPVPRYMVTIGPPPAPHLPLAPKPRPAREFGVEVESWLRDGRDGILGLLDIKGWGRSVTTLDPARIASLKDGIGRLAEATGGADMVVGELGEGRFGVLGRPGTDLGRLGGALQELVDGFFAGGQVQVERAGLDLGASAMTVTQSLQALRLVLARFGAAGMEGAAVTGLAGGLAGIIEHASEQKRALAALIASGRLAQAYQPIVRLAGRTVHHYEALLRPPPNVIRDAATPQDFVTLVEAVGLSRELDLAVLDMALAILRQTQAAVAVNVSGLSIADADFTRAVLDRIAGLPRGRLLVEITETVEIDDLPAAAIQLERLRAAGVQVCLDDFGAGAASLRYVRDLRFDFVKIDGSYVRAAGRSEEGGAFIRAMCDLAESAGAQTIAEMIETEADAALMAGLGVAFGQGWLFGKPGAIPPAAPSPAVARWRY